MRCVSSVPSVRLLPQAPAPTWKPGPHPHLPGLPLSPNALGSTCLSPAILHLVSEFLGRHGAQL